MDDDMDDDKVCLVTGANSGIGLEIAKGLARRGATVVMAARNREKGEAARAQVARETGNDRVELLLGDLASLAQVRRLAEDFTARHDRLHLLVNNAGVVMVRRELSEDGYEYTFAVNHLAPFLLTNLLLEVVKASAPARIVTVSSNAHRGQRMNFDDLQSERSYFGFRVYGTTKLENILFTTELARRLEGTGVTANAVHPGFVASNFGRNNGGPFRGFITLMQRVIGLSPEQGAQTPLYVATSPEVEGVTGRYFEKGKQRHPSTQALSVDDARRLWDVSERLVGQKVG